MRMYAAHLYLTMAIHMRARMVIRTVLVMDISMST